MKRGVWFRGVILLVLVVMVAGLGGCSRSAEEREGPTSAPAATSVGSTGEETAPAPGETVVSAVSPVPQTPGTEVQPTATEETPVVEPTVEATTEATATPAPTSPPTSGGQQGQYVTHTVQRGETLSSIARNYGTTWQAIAQANNIANPSQIYAGQSLKIPTSGGTSGGSSGGTAGCRYHHTVQRGEWLWQIAREYGVSPYAIMSANGLSLPSASTIYAGTVLCIP
jgi:LysM repeat protein